MTFIPRPYQQEAINAGLKFFRDSKKYNAIEILPTGSGKSVIIANIAKELPGRTIVFQPSREILVQNFGKFISYGYHAGIYSASAGQKKLGKITFATIGSVINKKELFKEVDHIIIDECHGVNAQQGMYLEFIQSLPDSKALGLTATPYRLAHNSFGAILRFLTRTRPRVFTEVLYYVQNKILFDSGFLAKLEYFDISKVNRDVLQLNSSGSDFEQASLERYLRTIKMTKIIIHYANRLLSKRKNLLVFCASLTEAEDASKEIPGSIVITGTTPMSDRKLMLAKFLKGEIRCVLNMGVLTTGFDYPELECILISRPTMSLALYYQMIGRGMRPHPNKQSSWIIDLAGNYRYFGKIETMKIVEDEKKLYSLWQGNEKQLTNIILQKK